MGRIRNRLFGHSGWIQAITFRNDDDGSTLASVDDDTVRVWNVLRGDCLHRLSVRIFYRCFFYRFQNELSFRLLMIYLVLFVSYQTIVVY